MLSMHNFLRLFRTRTAAALLTLIAFLHPVEAFPQVTCQLATSVCADSTPCKTISGVSVCLGWVNPLPAGSLQVPQSCWGSTGSYQCADSTNITTNTCATLDANPNCGPIGSTCISTDSSGNCLSYSFTYQCQQGGGVSSTTDCSGETFCQDGTCFTKKDKPNNSLVKVVTAQEIARQAGYYADPATMQIFRGDPAKCSINTLGLANCCKPNDQGANFTDGLIAEQLAKMGWNQFVNITGMIGSQYTFDTLFDKAAGFLGQEYSGIAKTVSTVTGYQPGTSTWTSGPGSGTFSAAGVGGFVGGMVGQQLAVSMFCSSCSPTEQGIVGAFGYAGGTVAGTWAGGAMSAFASGASTTTAISTGNSAVASMCMPCLVVAVVIMIIMALLACDKEEAKTQLKLGAHICHLVGSYCSTDTPLGCLTMTNAYCCFNSKLSKIVNEQGRPQIGKSWGMPQAPDCSGFTVDQIQQLDFTKMDFSEFYKDVFAKAMPNQQQLSNQVTNSINNFYANTGGNVTSTNGVMNQQNGSTPVNVAINDVPPPIPPMPTCTTSITKTPPLQNGDQSGVLAITSCQPSGSAAMKYSGDCGTLSGTASTTAFDTSGAVSIPVTIPAACAMNTNTWDIFVTDSSNNLLGKVSAQW